MLCLFLCLHISDSLTGEIKISQDDAGEKTVHVKLNPTVLHVLSNDGLD